MNQTLCKLSNSDLQELAVALASRRVAAPYSELMLTRVLSPKIAADVLNSLRAFEEAGFNETQIAATLELLVRDRNDGWKDKLPIDLVISGPEAPGIVNRDTSVVVRELFTHATKSVLVVGYAVYQGLSVFEALARRMDEVPELDVQLFLNIAREDRDATPAEIIVSRYVHRFRATQWPEGSRLPQVFYDPRSLDENKRSSLHAKCVVVDAEHVFVSSANFTKAGHDRNIEVGLLISSRHLAQGISSHFLTLKEHQGLIRAI